MNTKQTKKDNTSYSVYIAECGDGTLYTGITTDVVRRSAVHNSPKGGAKYTAARRPITLIYKEDFPDRSSATKRELQIKKMTRAEKITLTQKKKLQKVVVNDKMQHGYTYYRSEPVGRNFDPRFRPELTPKQMLELGIFGGKYMTDCRDEFPADWFKRAKLSPEGRDIQLNFFKIDASQPLSIWRRKGWIHPEDPRGWFQWYCRYYMGRRLPEEDNRQIKRWIAIRRHIAQIRNSCAPGSFDCRRRQRQAVLHWAYDSRRI